MPFLVIGLFCLFSAASGQPLRLEERTRPPIRLPLQITVHALLLADVGFTLEVTALDEHGVVDTSVSGPLTIKGVSLPKDENPVMVAGRFKTKGALCSKTGSAFIHASMLRVRPEEIARSPHMSISTGSATVRVIPGLLSILPPLLAILLALLLRQVIVSLFAGVWLGAVFVFDYDPFGGFLRVLDHYIINALANTDHMSIIAFSMLFGGMVGVISKSGGTLGIAEKLTRIARSPRGVQAATWLLGFVIFFDDYANSLIVGNTMRPITDRLNVSREKLAFLVDATAAPVTAVLFISTWIGYEVGLIDAAMKSVGYVGHNAYAVFLDMLPYSFYPILTLVFGAMIAFSGRDFGPMATAELRARRTGKLYRDGAQLATDLTDSSAVMPDEGVQPRWWNAAIPIFVVVAGALVGLWYTGTQAIVEAGGTDFGIGNVIGQANSYKALLWASLLSCVVAIALAVGQRILGIIQAMDAWFNGLKSMLLAMLILTLAWSIGQITAELHTADYLVQILKGNLPPQWLPAATFIVAAVISFATGTSWGTMGIMMPIVIPLSIVLGQDAGLAADPAYVITLGTIASVLAGAVFGDHCSPISDTTILSSMASACDHIDHVRTQLPYALSVAGVALLGGLLPSAYGVPPIFSLLIGSGLLAGLLFWRGTSTA
ncbi:MAG: Na+/H+ antiporter NhaC family protein [Bacteroidetes bacterium]|nr:Na+/H+ antiporter NhaC family protein [Bacteroidota bacterium]